MNRYLVIARRLPHCDPALVQPHKDYLESLRASGALELTGPFANAPGGAYLLRAADLAAAQALVEQDPAHVSGGWELTVYEWQAR